MPDELRDHGIGDRGDIRPHAGGFQHMDGMADTCHDDFRLKEIIRENVHNLGHHLHARSGDVVQPSHKRAHVGRPRFGGQQGLQRRKDQRHVGLNPFIGTNLDGFETFFGHGDFDNHVAVDGGQFPGFRNHGVGGGAHGFGAHRSLHDVADLFDMRPKALTIRNPFLGDQGRIGRHAVENPQRVGFLDFIQVGRIDEEFHSSFGSFLRRAA